jgi:tRNA(Ile2) C34 agmatinyltransferase TiaS
MRVYVGFDDTDVVGADRGTGKFARWFKEKLPKGVRLHGVVRQQLPVLEGIPYTSQNSSACLIVDNVETSQVQELIDRGAEHIREHFIEGSDPGLCVVVPNGSTAQSLLDFGRLASSKIVTQQQAMQAANGFHLSGHGGTNDGIIGAAAGVGLTISGWSGRFIEFNGLRDFGTMVKVSDLEARGIHVLSVDRNALVTGPDDIVDTRDWIRPRLWGGAAVLPVESCGHGSWRCTSGKNKKPE